MTVVRTTVWKKDIWGEHKRRHKHQKKSKYFGQSSCVVVVIIICSIAFSNSFFVPFDCPKKDVKKRVQNTQKRSIWLLFKHLWNQQWTVLCCASDSRCLSRSLLVFLFEGERWKVTMGTKKHKSGEEEKIKEKNK